MIFILYKKRIENLKKTNDVKLITKKVNEIVKKKMLIPTATTHYERIYLISLNKKVRATIDYNLKGTKVIARVCVSPGMIILEQLQYFFCRRERRKN